jgi:outer membrane protein assembly factor BamA
VASSEVGSDLDYTRHQVNVTYRYLQGRSEFLAATSGGRGRGALPLFERFSVGDTNTLRGWNKFDLAPAGGSRVFHQTFEYRYSPALIFLDMGSAWDDADARAMKYSTGFGVRNRFGFLTLGFPLNADELRVTFMAGLKL